MVYCDNLRSSRKAWLDYGLASMQIVSLSKARVFALDIQRAREIKKNIFFLISTFSVFASL